MKKTRFGEQQIALALRPAEQSVAAEEIIRKTGVSKVMFYRSKEKSSGMGMTELRRGRQLEDEKSKCKRPAVDLSGDNAVLKDLASRQV